MSDLAAFRQECRAWLEENCPPSMRTPPRPGDGVWGGRNATYKDPDAKIWLDRMAKKGWTAPTWPAKYGGGGLSRGKTQVLQQEMQKLSCRAPLQSFGLWMLGPVLLEFGNEEQRMEHLPGINRGEIRWCQGYSEPGAGSDLASLQTSAEDKGDHYLVNGSKIWTSYADKSDWIFCLVRTNKESKHEGISFLLFDMDDAGVTTQPIKLISGSSPFCQTFFDNVEVPKENLVGELNSGWTIAKRLLQHERTMVAGFGLANGGSGGATQFTVASIAKEYVGEQDGKIADPVVRNNVAAMEIKGEAFTLTLKRSTAEVKAGGNPGAATSMFKLYGTEHNKRRSEMLLELMGNQAIGWEQGDSFTSQEINITRSWLRSKGNSIEGGTSEIQKNVIAKRVLGLPE